MIHSDGAGMPHLHQKAGGSRMPPSAETVAKRLHYVHQEGAAVYKFAVAAHGGGRGRDDGAQQSDAPT